MKGGGGKSQKSFVWCGYSRRIKEWCFAIPKLLVGCCRPQCLQNFMVTQLSLPIHICFLKEMGGRVENLNWLWEARNWRSSLFWLVLEFLWPFLHYAFIKGQVILNHSVMLDKCLNSFLPQFLICKIMINRFVFHIYLKVVYGTENPHFCKHEEQRTPTWNCSHKRNKK